MQDTTQTTLGELRRKRGIPAIALASTIGVSRQTIYAIEAGTFVPNTAVALRLARALDSTVEQLFSLAEPAPVPELRSEQASILPGAGDVEPGQPLQLCRVGKRLMASPPSSVPWYFPAMDAVLADKSAGAGKAHVQIFDPERDFANRIFVAGCDPGISVLSRHAHAAGIELVLAHRNSSQSLALLKQGCIHVAGTHLKDEAWRLFSRHSVAVISFAVWEQGIVTARGNPKGIRKIEDFARKDVQIVNREEGAGNRAMLDSGLKHAGIGKQQIRGYDNLAHGHLPAAWQVQSGAVDCCLATRGAARLFGLHFVPLLTERYDLVIRKQHLAIPAIQNFCDILSRSDFRRELEGLGGYDTRVAGQRVL